MKRWLPGIVASGLAASVLVTGQGPQPFKLGTFERAGRPFVGIVLGDAVVIDVTAANIAIRTPTAKVAAPTDMKDLISRYDQGLRDRILRMSAESGGSENTQFLKEIALDPRARSELRDRAIRLMVDGGLPTADLVKMYDAIDETQLRDRVIRLLGDRGDRAGMDKLLDIAKNDPSSDLRRRAVRILSERGDTRVKELVEERVKK
jgi:HEAT repeat protein